MNDDLTDLTVVACRETLFSFFIFHFFFDLFWQTTSFEAYIPILAYPGIILPWVKIGCLILMR